MARQMSDTELHRHFGALAKEIVQDVSEDRGGDALNLVETGVALDPVRLALAIAVLAAEQTNDGGFRQQASPQ